MGERAVMNGSITVDGEGFVVPFLPVHILAFFLCISARREEYTCRSASWPLISAHPLMGSLT